MRRAIIYLLTLILGFIFLNSLNSCVSTKDLAYFNNIKKDSIAQIQLQSIETIISKNDVLQINISTLDPVTTAIFNSTGTVNAGVSSTSGVTGGYLVDETGVVKIPLIGTIKAAGLTKRELAGKITDNILSKKLAIDPIVTVRIINYKITVLGEVARPGVITVPNEKITLPEALGQAGDLTIYGKRDNVLLIREVGGVRTMKRINLNNDNLFNKDVYNLQNEDIIYVEPNKSRALSSDFTTQLLPIGVSLVSLIIIIYTQFKH